MASLLALGACTFFVSEALAQSPSLDDDTMRWPAAALRAAGVGDFGSVAWQLEHEADVATGEAAVAALEGAMRVHDALGEHSAVEADLSRVLALGAHDPALTARVWDAVERTLAPCEAEAARTLDEDARAVMWRRCELRYRDALLRVGDRVANVTVRAHAALARTLWGLGDDAAARREARIALDAWRHESHDATRDWYVDGPDVLTAGREMLLREFRGLMRFDAPMLRCYERMESGPPYHSRQAVREICSTETGLPGGAGGMAYAGPTDWFMYRAWDVGNLTSVASDAGSDPLARSRDAVASLRFALARRTYALAVADLMVGDTWREPSPRSALVADRTSYLRPQFEELPRRLFWAQLASLAATESPRWGLRAAALHAELMARWSASVERATPMLGIYSLEALRDRTQQSRAMAREVAEVCLRGATEARDADVYSRCFVLWDRHGDRVSDDAFIPALSLSDESPLRH